MEPEQISQLNKEIDNEIENVKKIAHPPAIDLKEFNEIKTAFKKMKKVTLLKSVFK